jgi:D-lactate dehydrogenase (cytochrome)
MATVLQYGSTAAALDEVRGLLGNRLVETTTIREQHGVGEGWQPGAAPEAVAFPTSTDEVARIVRACAEHRVPLIPFGSGTSLEGHVDALHGGICLALSGMDRIVEVNVDDLDCTVEAGVRRIQLAERLRGAGLFFPIDPGADATIGGMSATRASGTNAVRYGTMRDNVLALTAVLPDGEVIRTGSRARKSSAGYDLTRLLVGSEGTLAVITEVTLRLYGIPEAVAAAVCPFATLDGAVRTVIETIQLGIPVARIELIDEVQIRASNRHASLNLDEAPTLFLEFHGTERGVAEQAETFGEIAAGHGQTGWSWTTDTAERNHLWKARHEAYYAALAMRPGSKGLPTDVCVPISRLADCILETQRDNDEAGVLAPIVGHVGDGNFHLIYLLDPDDADELRVIKRLNTGLVERALAMGGTSTGEHGIGYGKLDFLEAEHGPAAVALMRNVKNAIDPLGIMNPGKVIPPEE